MFTGLRNSLCLAGLTAASLSISIVQTASAAKRPQITPTKKTAPSKIKAAHAGTGSSASSAFAEGARLYSLGQYREAAKFFSQVISRSPADTRAHYYMGLILMRFQQNEPAQKEFEYIVSASPESEEAELSMQALQALSAQPAAEQAQGPPAGQSTQEMQRAESHMQHLAEEEAKISSEVEAQAARITEEAEQRAAKLDEQIRQTETDMGNSRYRGVGGWWPTYSKNDIDEATADMRKRAQQIRADAARRAKALVDEAKARLAAQR